MYFQNGFGCAKRKIVTKVLLFFSPFQIAYALVNVPTISRFYVWSKNFRKRYAPTDPAIFLAIFGSCAPKRVNKILDVFPWMASVKYPHNGLTPLHFACDPLQCGDVEIVSKLLEIFPEAVRVCNKASGSIPLNYVFSCRGFGADDPRRVRKISKMKRKK